MNEVKYKKGDYVGCECIYLNEVHIVKLLEDSYKDETYAFPIIRAKVQLLPFNQNMQDYIHNSFILEGEYYRAKKVNYMNTALYKVLYKGL